MKLRYRYRIYPNNEQVKSLAQIFGCSRVVWNDALAFCQETYKTEGKYPGFASLAKMFVTEAKRTEFRAWLSDVSVVPLQQSLRILDVAFRNFFNSVTGKRKGPKVKTPRFKKRNSKQSAEFTKRGFSLRDNDKLFLAKIGELKVKWSRPLPAAPSSVTVIKNAAGQYFASFVVEVAQVDLSESPSSIGVDLGIATFATLSTGEKIEAPKPLKANLKKLARLQRNLARCEKGSNRREVAKRKVAKLHQRIQDIRTDFLHKLSSRLIFENQEINLEDLNVSGMVKNRCLSKAISDMGWRAFRTMLEAKALMYGRTVNIISRWEPTSQTCSTCGFRGGKKELSVREWVCISCGVVHDRDVNAAINIKVAGGQSETVNGRRRTRKTGVKPARSVDASTQLEYFQLRLFGC